MSTTYTQQIHLVLADKRLNKLTINDGTTDKEVYGANINDNWFYLKAITLDLTTNIPVGVNTISCKRTLSPKANAAKKILEQGDLVFYGDILQISATASEGYNDPIISQSGEALELTTAFLDSHSTTLYASNYVSAGTKKKYKLKIYGENADANTTYWGNFSKYNFKYGLRLQLYSGFDPVPTESISKLIEVWNYQTNSKGDLVKDTLYTLTFQTDHWEAEITYEDNFGLSICTGDLYYGCKNGSGRVVEYLNDKTRINKYTQQSSTFQNASTTEGEPDYSPDYLQCRYSYDDIVISGWQSTLNDNPGTLLYQCIDTPLNNLPIYSDKPEISAKYGYRWNNDCVETKAESTGLVGQISFSYMAMPAHDLVYKFKIKQKKQIEFNLSDDFTVASYYKKDEGDAIAHCYPMVSNRTSTTAIPYNQDYQYGVLPLGMYLKEGLINFTVDEEVYPVHWGYHEAAGATEIVSSNACYQALRYFPSTEIYIQENIQSEHSTGNVQSNINWTYSPLAYNNPDGHDKTVTYRPTDSTVIGYLDNVTRWWYERVNDSNKKYIGLVRQFKYTQSYTNKPTATYRIGGVQLYGPDNMKTVSTGFSNPVELL